MRISHFGAFSFFAGTAVLEIVLPFIVKFDEWYVIAFVHFCAVINLVFGIIYGKYHVLTEKGIQHKFLGICYRRTSWDHIKDIMLVYQQTGERGRPKTLMLTKEDGIVYRPDASGYIKEKGFTIQWLRGKILSIRCDDKKTAHKILWYVENYYGPLDYNFFE